MLKSVLRYAEYAAFRLVAALVRALPLDAASDIMGFLWRTIAPHTSRQKRALDHIGAAFPHMGLAERRNLSLRMWDNLGRTAAESLCLDRIIADPARLDNQAQQTVERMRDDGKGGILVSLHMGNWEITILPTLLAGMPIMSAYQRIKNPLVDAYVRRNRSRLYPAGLHAKGARTGRLLYDFVAKGGHVGLLVDHRDVRGVPIRFFGRDAMTSLFPAALALRLGVPLAVGRTVRTKGARFRIEAEVVDFQPSGDDENDAIELTQAYYSIFETWIRERPEQWMWIHERWRTRQPADSTDRTQAEPLERAARSGRSL